MSKITPHGTHLPRGPRIKNTGKAVMAVGFTLLIVAASLFIIKNISAPDNTSADEALNLQQIPDFSGNPFVKINNNKPDFTASEITDVSYESYSELDELGRCGKAEACIGADIMPTEERENIGQVKPSGWHTVKYDSVDGKYLYNRCHLIGFQLTGENANIKNLITGTRYMNTEGMLPFENMTADYIKETGNHVMYRVTPIFRGSDLVAAGVQMEAYSVEDNGNGICFNVYVYNCQPGIEIDYTTGDSKIADGISDTDKNNSSGDKANTANEYVINTNTKKFHLPSCSLVSQISEKNREDFAGSRETLIKYNYAPCKNCKP